MKFVLALLGLLAAFSNFSAADQMYTTKYDNIDLDEILNNQRLYNKYFECLIGKGKCTPDGKQLKDLLPDALATDCSKCSEKQKAGSDKVIGFMLTKKPRDYEAIEKIYDPTRSYRKKHQPKAA